MIFDNDCNIDLINMYKRVCKFCGRYVEIEFSMSGLIELSLNV